MNGIGAAKRSLAALAIALAAAPGVASAQDYPTKSIRMVVPFPPGGFSDVFARIIGGKMHESWGQQVIVDNRPGAGGNIGADIVAKSAPDGYSLVMGTIGTHAINATLFSRLPYDPIRDFVAVAFVVGADGLLVVHPSLPVHSTKELIALARSKPGALTYASAGAGTTSHLAGELFKSITKTDITHVPYKGNVPAITDLLSGQTTMLFATLPTVLPQVQANRLRPLAVLGTTRSAALPAMPTLSEAGLKGFEVSNWTGVFAPAGTPSAIIAKLNAEIVRIMRLPDVQERLPRQGLTFVPGTPQQFAAFVRSEKDKWGALVKAVGARVD
ncbi:MAG TPA: tripartite tricarboxylate transporter substrate binding protein [Burkholderiales bacterium]|nr:tripartite tricarboxylate transporter substrate binding protein [Burkholderiales bacterium]